MTFSWIYRLVCPYAVTLIVFIAYSAKACNRVSRISCASVDRIKASNRRVLASLNIDPSIQNPSYVHLRSKNSSTVFNGVDDPKISSDTKELALPKHAKIK